MATPSNSIESVEFNKHVFKDDHKHDKKPNVEIFQGGATKTTQLKDYYS